MNNHYICANIKFSMKRFWIALCFMFFLLFTGGIAERAFSIDLEDIEAMRQSSDNTCYADGDVFHCSPAIFEINSPSQAHQGVHSPKVQRSFVLQVAAFFKNLSRNLSGLDSAFAQNNEHIYNTTNSFYSKSPSKYYVFALRHIII